MAASFLTFLQPLTTKAPVSFISKKQYKQTSKAYPADTWFSSDQSVYQTGIYQASLGHCVASNQLPPAPG